MKACVFPSSTQKFLSNNRRISDRLYQGLRLRMNRHYTALFTNFDFFSQKNKNCITFPEFLLPSGGGMVHKVAGLGKATLVMNWLIYNVTCKETFTFVVNRQFLPVRVTFLF